LNALTINCLENKPLENCDILSFVAMTYPYQEIITEGVYHSRVGISSKPMSRKIQNIVSLEGRRFFLAQHSNTCPTNGRLYSLHSQV
jgi:hypothetical protein